MGSRRRTTRAENVLWRISKRGCARFALDQARTAEALPQRFPERVRGVDAEDFELGGEELELFEGETDVALFGVAFDVGVELGGVERAFELIGVELRHVH